MTFDLKSFDYTSAELQELVEEYSWLSIESIEDKPWYDAVKQARLDLRNKRTTIEKTGKAMRDEANAFNKSVLAREKELIGIVEPLENILKQEEEKFEKLIEIEKRKQRLPERRQRLEEIGLEVDDADILKMEDVDFDNFVNRKAAEKLAADRQALEDEKAAVAAEKKKVEDEKAAIARKEEIELAQKEAAEKSRIETEDRLKREAEDAERKKQEEMAKNEANKKYKARLLKHGCTDENKEDYFVSTKDGKTHILYKKIDSFTL